MSQEKLSHGTICKFEPASQNCNWNNPTPQAQLNSQIPVRKRTHKALIHDLCKTVCQCTLETGGEKEREALTRVTNTHFPLRQSEQWELPVGGTLTEQPKPKASRHTRPLTYSKVSYQQLSTQIRLDVFVLYLSYTVYGV